MNKTHHPPDAIWQNGDAALVRCPILVQVEKRGVAGRCIYCLPPQVG